ncbi:hypothetical protein EC991_000891 [Linnemannia zychae]|nr:hypothetical protein EC991_000891 [Linnemannia zychae]
MATVTSHTTTVATHSHSFAPGPVITTSPVSALPNPSGSAFPSIPVVSGAPGVSPSGGPAAPPSATPSKPSSAAAATNIQKKLSLAFALMVFLPAVINAL